MPDTRLDFPPERSLAPPLRAPALHAARPLRLLLVFEKEWDAGGFAPLLQANEVRVFAEGFDLFRFPGNARVLSFDAWRFVDRMCERYRGRIDAVVSNNEQFGALLAAVIAQRLGLPGNDPAAVARAQHKLAARHAQRAAVPEATIASAALPLALGDPRTRDAQQLTAALASVGFALPAFVKPIKATFSVLARRVDDADTLARHLTFGQIERLIIERLVAPYGQLAARLIDAPCPATAMMVEECVDGRQVNVDGYALEGDVRVLGIVDEWLYPGEHAGARHFLRFAYPSLIDDITQARIATLTRRVLAALGFRHGFFTCEFFVCRDGRIRFIEVNPRLATQLVSLYRDVAGFDIYRMLVALAAGRDPAHVARLTVRRGAAASFVFRTFDGSAGRAPAAGARAWLAERHPGAHLETYFKRGRALAREYKWLGSHRYAVLNASAIDAAALERQFIEICARFGWPYQPLENQSDAVLNPAKMSQRSGNAKLR